MERRTSAQVCNFDIPPAVRFVPPGSGDHMLHRTVLVQIVLGCKSVKISEYFVGTRIHFGPVRVWFETPSIGVCWDVTGTSSAAIVSITQGRTRVTLTQDICFHARFPLLDHSFRIGQD